MNTVIYYFTGTGNSLLLANLIASRVKDTKLISLSHIYHSDDSTLASISGAIGFVFPVYFKDIPRFVYSAVKKLRFIPGQYVFAAVTSGGQPGITLRHFDALLRSRGARLDYGRHVDMPDNSILIHTPREKAENLIAQADASAEDIAASVNCRLHTEKVLHGHPVISVTGKLMQLGVDYLYNALDRKVDPGLCTHCGMCASICPARNININNGNIFIGKNCAHCFACLNWCPQKAISFGRVDPGKKGQYRCPGISAADIINLNRT